jgi:hypothetical protein
MLTRAQLALCQADAIARLARLRSCLSVQLTPERHLTLEIPPQGHNWVRHTLGPYSGNVARVLCWEATQVPMR